MFVLSTLCQFDIYYNRLKPKCKLGMQEMLDRIKADGFQKEQWESGAFAEISTAISTTSSTNDASRFHNTNFYYFQ